MDHVIWHDVECGSYAADLPLWRELAAAAGGPILDVGAGTGRVALDLAAATGRADVHALDVDRVLLEALRERAADRGLTVTTHAGDARDFDLPGLRFALILAPMQTVQLLEGAEGRRRFLTSARRHLRPGGLLACAIAHDVDAFEGAAHVPVPDLREVEGVVYASRPIAVRDDGGGFVLERLRERVATDGTHEVTEDRIRLDRLSAATFEREAAEHRFAVEPRLTIEETDDHVGSEVAVLRA
jgi:SAM-dependent methyltransferase